MRLRFTAKNDHQVRFNNLMCQLKVDLLCRVYHSLSANKARGMDGMTKARYGKSLEGNLRELEDKLHKGTYRPSPSRQVLIPKGNGKMRPLAVSNFEDKIVQGAVAEILGSIYEPLFLDPSLGFRPKRGCHQALRRIYHLLKEGQRPYVVDVDIEKFFDSMNHERMMTFLQNKIQDPRLLRLLARMLKTGIWKGGAVEVNEVGSPQGSIISPLLANIYLHYVLDQWFKEQVAGYHQQMVRYADDVVFCFRNQGKAKDFLRKLKERLLENQLRLNEAKTKVVNFRRENHQVFHFLGFTLYWGRDRKKKVLLKVKTQSERFRSKILAFKTWIKENRHRYRTKVLWEKAAAKLRGHYAYFGVTFNTRVNLFYAICTQLLFKWLNRRSQKRSFTWEGFRRRLMHHPLPRPWGCHLVTLNQGVLAYAV